MLLLKRVGTTAAPAVPCSEATGKRKPRTRSLLLGVREGETPTPKHTLPKKIGFPTRSDVNPHFNTSAPLCSKPVLKKGIPRFPSFLPCVPEACPQEGDPPPKFSPKEPRGPSPKAKRVSRRVCSTKRGSPIFREKSKVDSRVGSRKEIQSQPFIRRPSAEHVDGPFPFLF